MRTLAVLWTVAAGLRAANEARHQMSAANKGPLHGVWEVEDFELDGKPVPPLLTGSRRWRRAIVDDRGGRASFTIPPISGASTRRHVAIEAKAMRSLPNDPATKVEFPVEQPQPDRLTLGGKMLDRKGEEFLARMRKIDAGNFLLLDRGFHWISERPFN